MRIETYTPYECMCSNGEKHILVFDGEHWREPHTWKLAFPVVGSVITWCKAPERERIGGVGWLNGK